MIIQTDPCKYVWRALILYWGVNSPEKRLCTALYYNCHNTVTVNWWVHPQIPIISSSNVININPSEIYGVPVYIHLRTDDV